VRNLIRAVDFLPVGYGFGLTAMLLNRDFKRLGDIAGGTVVVVPPSGAETIVYPRGTAVPALRTLSLSETACRIGLSAERSAALTPERARRSRS